MYEDMEEYVWILLNQNTGIIMLKESVHILETKAKTLMDRAIWYLGFVSGWCGREEMDRSSVETRLAASQLLYTKYTEVRYTVLLCIIWISPQ